MLEVHSTNLPHQIIYTVLVHHQYLQFYVSMNYIAALRKQSIVIFARLGSIFLRKYKCISGNEFIAVELKNI